MLVKCIPWRTCAPTISEVLAPGMSWPFLCNCGDLSELSHLRCDDGFLEADFWILFQDSGSTKRAVEIATVTVCIAMPEDDIFWPAMTLL